jgi:hypothetical protein
MASRVTINEKVVKPLQELAREMFSESIDLAEELAEYQGDLPCRHPGCGSTAECWKCRKTPAISYRLSNRPFDLHELLRCAQCRRFIPPGHDWKVDENSPVICEECYRMDKRVRGQH